MAKFHPLAPPLDTTAEYALHTLRAMSSWWCVVCVTLQKVHSQKQTRKASRATFFYFFLSWGKQWKCLDPWHPVPHPLWGFESNRPWVLGWYRVSHRQLQVFLLSGLLKNITYLRARLEQTARHRLPRRSVYSAGTKLFHIGSPGVNVFR